MTENAVYEVGNVVRFEGLHLSRGPLPATVRATCQRFALLSYRVGGLDRVVVVDLAERTRSALDDEELAARWARSGRFQDLLDALCEGRLGLRGATALDPVRAA